MAESFFRGHQVYYDFDSRIWRFIDNGKPVGSRKLLPCKKCGCLPSKDGHDTCLGKLPGIKAACCGHGAKKSYVIWKDGVKVYFDSWS